MGCMPRAKQLVVSCIYFCGMLCIALSSELIFSQNAQLFQKTSTGVPSDFHLATNFEVAQNATFWAKICNCKFRPKKRQFGTIDAKINLARNRPKSHFWQCAKFVARWKSDGTPVEVFWKSCAFCEKINSEERAMQSMLQKYTHETTNCLAHGM